MGHRGVHRKSFWSTRTRTTNASGAIGRLKDGVNLNQAQAKVDSLVANLQTEFPKEYPPQAGWSVRVLSAHQQLVGNVQTILYVVLAAVGLVLLIGCVNLA